MHVPAEAICLGVQLQLHDDAKEAVAASDAVKEGSVLGAAAVHKVALVCDNRHGGYTVCNAQAASITTNGIRGDGACHRALQDEGYRKRRP